MAPASTASSAPASAVVDVAAHPLAAEQQQQQEDPLSAAAAASDADGGRTTPTPRSVSGTAGVAKSTASVAARSPDSEAADAASPQLTRGGAEGASPAIGSSTHHGWLPLQGPNESSDTLNGSAASPQQRSWSGSARKIGYPYGQKNEEEQEAEAVEQVSQRIREQCSVTLWDALHGERCGIGPEIWLPVSFQHCCQQGPSVCLQK